MAFAWHINGFKRLKVALNGLIRPAGAHHKLNAILDGMPVDPRANYVTIPCTAADVIATYDLTKLHLFQVVGSGHVGCRTRNGYVVGTWIHRHAVQDGVQQCLFMGGGIRGHPKPPAGGNCSSSEGGGLAPGGINFDAKLRRESTEELEGGNCINLRVLMMPPLIPL
eukprot:1191007-Prorocentrum_minimum.AAC.3